MADWKFWKITDEQANAIKKGDMNAINTFYANNYEQFRKMAFNYAEAHRIKTVSVSDLLSSLYVDLTVFRRSYSCPIKNGRDLSFFVYYSFRWCGYGGLAYLFKNNPKLLCGGRFYFPELGTRSLDEPFGGAHGRGMNPDERTLADIIPARFSLDDMIDTDQTEEYKAVVADYLSPRSFEYFCYYIDGYNPKEICERMGIPLIHNFTYYKRMCGTLSRYAGDICERCGLSYS